MSTRLASPLTVLMLFTLLAGCATPSSGEVEPDPPRTQLIEKDLEFQLTQRRVAGSHASDSDNCILIPDSVKVKSGTVELVWTPTTDVARELTLEVAEGPGNILALKTGPSPVIVTLPEAAAKSPDIRFFGFAAILDTEGVIIAQPVRMRASVLVETPENVSVEIGSCSST